MKTTAIIKIAAVMLIAMLFTGCSFNVGALGNNIHINEKEISEFDSVSVTTSLSNIEFVASDQYGLEIFVPERFAPEWYVTNGQLVIKEKTTDFFINLSIHSPRYYVKVFYPAGVNFNDINLITASGQIELPRVDVADLSIISSSGRVYSNAEKCSYVSIESASGSVTFSGSGGNVDIRTASGRVDSNIDNCEAVKVITSSGNVALTGTGDIATALTVNTSSGSINVKGAVWRDINLVSGSGSTTVNGELRGNTSVSTASGSVRISVNGDPSQFGYDLTPSSGSIHWNGEKIAKPAISSGSFDNNISVNTSSGSIRVDFI